MVHRQNMFSCFMNHSTIQTFLFAGPPSNTAKFSKCQALACLKLHQELIHGMLEDHKNSHSGEPDNPILRGFVYGDGSVGKQNTILDYTKVRALIGWKEKSTKAILNSKISPKLTSLTSKPFPNQVFN